MKTTLLFFSIIFLSIQCSFSQSGEIIYKNEPGLPEGLEEMKKTDPQKYKRYSFMINQMNEKTKRLRFTLEFNTEHSKFTTNPTMAKEDNAMASMSMPESKFYYDLQKNERYEVSKLSGKELLVDKTPIEWSISKETKIIQGFTCRKAEAVQLFYSVDRDSGELRTKEQSITAWFTTDLPFSFGPENYGGLPGLVLELSTQGKNYKVEKINIKENKRMTIDFPDTENAMSEKESAKQLHKAMSNMMGG